MTEDAALALARQLNALYSEAGLDYFQIVAVEAVACNLRLLSERR